MIDLASYVDGALSILTSRGVTEKEIEDAGIQDMLITAHMKGRPWTDAVEAVCAKFDIQVE